MAGGYHECADIVDPAMRDRYREAVRRLGSWLAVGAAVAPGGWAATASAQSHACTPVSDPSVPLTQVWHATNRCIPLYVDRASTLFASEAGIARVEASLAAWNEPTCSDLRLVLMGRTDQRVGFDPQSADNQNVITEVVQPADVELLTQRDALATTITAFRVSTGEIFDADILFASPDTFRFVDVASEAACRAQATPNCRSADDPYDIRNTLVHELGHVLGFDHISDRDSTMAPDAGCCETSKRSLASVDVTGLCEVYPVDAPSQTCQPAADYGEAPCFRNQCNGGGSCPEDGGCRSAGSSGSSATGAGAGALIGLWLARRRRRAGACSAGGAFSDTRT